jgi:hypothetical protein
MFHWNHVVRNVFLYLVVFRIVGLTDYSALEAQHVITGSEAENESVAAIVAERLAVITECATDEAKFQATFPPETWAYRLKAWTDFRKRTDEEYPEWLAKAKAFTGERTFPFPDIKIESIFDNVEKTIEEW